MSNEVRLHASMKDDVSGPLSKIRYQFEHLSANKAGQAVLEGVGVGAGISVYNALGDAVSKVGDFFRDSVQAALEESRIEAQTAAAIRSTGGAANVTADQIHELAKQIQDYSGINDDAVQSGENLLLTFTNIKNQVGAGNDVFDQATKVLADLSTALGEDMSSAAIQLGKALNDPISGLTALRRVGVSFTEQQKSQIEAMQRSGNLLGAQKVILGELTREFGGSAKAYGDSAAGGVAKFNNAMEDLEKEVGERILPVLGSMAEFLAKDVVPALSDTIDLVSTGLGTLDQLAKALDGVVGSADRAGGAGGLLNDVLGALEGAVIPLLPETLELANDTERAKKALDAAGGAARESVAAWGDMSAGLEQAAASAGDAASSIDDAVRQSIPRTATELKALGDVMAQHAAALRHQMRQDAIKAGQSFADGLAQERDAIDAAFGDIVEGLKHPLTRSKEIAHDIGLLTSRALAQGLRSGDPELVAASEAERQRIIDRLNELATQTGPIGKDAMTALRRAMKSKDPEIAATAKDIYKTIHDNLPSASDASHWGSSIGSSWITALASAIRRGVNLQLARALANVNGQLAGKSPPKEGPLRTIDRDAEPVGMAWAGGLAKGIDRGLAGVSRSLSRVSLGLGAGSIPALAAAGGGAAPSTLQIHVHGVSVMTPGAAEALGRQLGPVVTRWQQVNRLAPRFGSGQSG